MDKTMLKKIVDTLFTALEGAATVKPWLLWPLKIINNLVDSWIDSGTLTLPVLVGAAPGVAFDGTSVLAPLFDKITALLANKPILSMAWEGIHLLLEALMPSILPKVNAVLAG